MATGRPELDGQRGLGDLLRELADGGAALVRQEVRLAKLEATEVASSIGRGTAWVGMGGVFLLIGTLAFLTGLLMLAGDQWLRDQIWLAALIMTVIAGGVAAWLARRGLSYLSPANLVPDQTVETLKEDKEWLKRQLTSGATSS